MTIWPAAQAPLAALPDPLDVPVPTRLVGAVRPPSSKSYSHRFLNLGLLLDRPLLVEQPLWAEDTELFVTALARLGLALERGEDYVRLGRREPPAAETRVDCGNAGTMFRFLTASLCAVPGRFVVDGTPRLRERPIGPLVDSLRQLGARIEYLERSGYAPLAITGDSLAGGACTLDAGSSSQYLSALVMAALRARAPVQIEVQDLASAPYVELTLAALAALDLPVPEREGSVYRVSPLPLELEARARVRVEPDWSAAAYPAAAAALIGGPVRIEGVRRDSVQGDRGIVDVLQMMGARLEWLDDALEIRGGGPLAATEVDLQAMPDQVPTVAAVAAFADGTTRIENVAHLRIKESDRLTAMAVGLANLGFQCEETREGLVIGRNAPTFRGAPPARVVVETFDDHRIAMAFTLVGLRRGGTAIAAPRVVGKSYREFFRDLSVLMVA